MDIDAKLSRNQFEIRKSFGQILMSRAGDQNIGESTSKFSRLGLPVDEFRSVSGIHSICSLPAQNFDNIFVVSCAVCLLLAAFSSHVNVIALQISTA